MKLVVMLVMLTHTLFIKSDQKFKSLALENKLDRVWNHEKRNQEKGITKNKVKNILLSLSVYLFE